jgi:hypothetical protein
MTRVEEKPGISEKVFESQVKSLAKQLNWAYYHTYRSTHSPEGFPDCVFVKGKRVIFAELKKDDCKTSQLSAEQYEWLSALIEAGQEVYLWRPADFDNIVNILLGITKKVPDE